MTNKVRPTQENWRNAILRDDASVGDAIRNLNSHGMRIVLIVSQQGVFQGTITDGDIRRGILRGVTLSSPLTDILHRNALIVQKEVTHHAAQLLMTANRINHIPIVDENQYIAGLHEREDSYLPKVHSNVIVIMAGGIGSRLRPETENCPKPLLHIDGKPMLEHIIHRAKNLGFNNFVIAIHYLGHMIEEYFADGAHFGVQINYLRETSPLGTAGALALLDPPPSEPFLVINGDVISDIRYGEILEYHILQNSQATMAVRKHEWQNPFGVVQMKGVEIIGFEEKPVTTHYINAGIYVLNPESLNALNGGEVCDMPTLFKRLHDDKKRTVAYPMHETWLDVGRPSDLAKARSTLK